jgi:two-component system phosphate regulon sensor histidine kinase PhoR
MIAIIGILIVQLLWTKEAFSNEGKKFSQSVHITLLHVIDRLYKINNNEFPLANPIHKVSNDYYIVNVNNDFDAEVLEYCLKSEFERSNLLTDFEYAIYKCESDEMVYGNYVSFTQSGKTKSDFRFPKQKNLVYYFAIRFPKETTYLLSSLKFWLYLSAILILILIIYVYSIFTILQQKKYSELQRDFINNMTHEFKTPLSSILIASTYLRKQKQINTDEKLTKYTDIISDQSRKLNDHIEKLLNIARFENTALQLNKKPVSIVPLIESIVDNFYLKFPSLKVTFDFPDNELFIQADAFHLSNLIYNLIDNSIKYCEGIPEIRIRLERQSKCVKLVFEDNGIGVPDKNRPFIFDKFYRVCNPISNETNGFGLGLYYVKKVCDLHFWKIEASANSEQGLIISLIIANET